MYKLSLGFSPCPNDCFIFDALVHGKIDTEGLEFEVVMEDVEALNRKAFEKELDITKLSFHAYAYLSNEYKLLNAGSALGFNCGPLLVQSSEFRVQNGIAEAPHSPPHSPSHSHSPNSELRTNNSQLSTIDSQLIAIPGKYTTANFLLSIAFPEAKNKKEMLFSSIENALLSGEVDAGLLIHENRFTYEQKGLKKIIDLGEFWENLIHAPIPLGGIVTRRRFPVELQKKIDRVIRKSIEYAFAHPESCMDFVKVHAQEMSEDVMKKHIALYVNEYSKDLGELGKKAVNLLFDKARSLKLVPEIHPDIFV